MERVNNPLIHALLTNVLNVVFNCAMTDAELIDDLGGPSRVAELLGLTERGAVQRISNWKRRGIPSRVLLEHSGVLVRRPAATAPAEEVRDAA